jgi:hypothetical protein
VFICRDATDVELSGLEFVDTLKHKVIAGDFKAEFPIIPAYVICENISPLPPLKLTTVVVSINAQSSLNPQHCVNFSLLAEA